MKVRAIVQLIFILIFCSCSIFRKTSKQDTVVHLGSLDDENFDEVKRLIGNAKVVFLGEANHFENGSLNTRNKLCMYMVDSLDFNIIVVEAQNLYEYFLIKTIEADTIDFSQAIAFNINFVPNRVMKKRVEFYRYLLPKIQYDSIYYYGMDIAGISVYGNAFIYEAPKYFRSLDSLAFERKKINNLILDFLAGGNLIKNSGYPPSYRDYVKGINLNQLLCMKDSLLNFLSKYDKTILDKELHTFWKWSIEDEYREKVATYINDRECYRYRDSIMSENILRVIKKHPKQKIIVLASNYHIANYNEFDFNYPCNSSKSMYSFFIDKFPKKSAVKNIACMAISHKDSLKNKCGLLKPRFEKHLLKKFGKNQLFLLQGVYCLEPSFHKPYKINWNQAYNGIVLSTEIGKYDYIYPPDKWKIPYKITENSPHYKRANRFDSLKDSTNIYCK